MKTTLVLFPGTAVSAPIKADIVLIPGKAALDAGNIASDCVITYGLDLRDTIGVTGIERDRLQLTVRREIMTVSGDVIEPCELPVRRVCISVEDDIALAAAMLVLNRRISE